MKDFRIPNRRCPWCDALVDAATPINSNEAPTPGDLMLCISCGEWAIEGEAHTLVKPTDDELREIGTNEDCQRARRAWADMKSIVYSTP